MKKNFWMSFLASTLILTACGSSSSLAPASTEIAAVTPSANLFTSGAVVASAKVEPAQETNMSFAISAPVKDVLVHEGDVVKAGQMLMTLYAPDLELSVTQAELQAKSKELDYVYWIPRLDRPPERREQARAEVELAKSQLEITKAIFAQTLLIAPFDATVVDIEVQPNESVQAGQVVITLGDLAHLQIKTTDLSERDVSNVHIGQIADVFIEALNQQLKGKVIRISPVSDTNGGDVVYPVTIQLNEQPSDLLWGMSAEVQIQTQ